MRRYLVVANQTLGSGQLEAKVRECMEADGCEFHIVVPATHTKTSLMWTEGEARALARTRLDTALARFRELGAAVDGEVGDEDPMLAISDALLARSFDELILSTLPAGASRWLRQDLPRRVNRNFSSVITVTHLARDLDHSIHTQG